MKNIFAYILLATAFFLHAAPALSAACQCKKTVGITTVPLPEPKNIPKTAAELPKGRVPTAPLSIVNYCDFPVWYQHDMKDPSLPRVIGPLKKGEQYVFPFGRGNMPPGTRVWPKTGCDAKGDKCAVGTTDTCPDAGCNPTVDSLLEVTWNDRTWFDISAVDGYTIPLGVTAIDADGELCAYSHPVGMDQEWGQCPKNEDLSLGGKYPKDANVDMRVISPGTGETVGCYAPCGKLIGKPEQGGLGNEESLQTDYYCCRGTVDCRTGPVKDTKYATSVHKNYNGNIYTWASDDPKGMLICNGIAFMQLTTCSK